MGQELDITKALSGLSEAGQRRILNSLKTHLDKEIAAEAASIGGALGQGASFDKQHDRGPLFGKDFDRQASEIDQMQQIARIDEAEFTKVADRLAQLKNVRGHQ